MLDKIGEYNAAKQKIPEIKQFMKWCLEFVVTHFS